MNSKHQTGSEVLKHRFLIFLTFFCTQMYLNDTTNFADVTSLCNDSKLQLTALPEQLIKISQGEEYDSSTSMSLVPRVYHTAH